MTDYCAEADVRRCENMKLGTNDGWSTANITSIITRQSAWIERKLGAQDTSDENIKELCTLLCWYHIGNMYPTAFAEGEHRETRVGQVSRWKRRISEIMEEYVGFNIYLA